MPSDEGPHTLCDCIYVTNGGMYVERHIEKRGGRIEKKLYPLNAQFKC